jgi:hypothetical protein
MAKANFIVPFSVETRQTILPVDKDGQPVPLDWWHVSLESGKTICVQVRADDAVIAAMKLDPAYQWLEDIPEPVIAAEPTEKLPVDEKLPAEGELEVKPVDPVVEAVAKCDPAEAKVFALSESTSFTKTVVDKMKWDTADNAIESVVKLHKQTLDGYKASGLG